MVNNCKLLPIFGKKFHHRCLIGPKSTIFHTLHQRSGPLQIFEHLKEINKFGIAGKRWPGRMLKLILTFWKKERIKVKKMKMKIFNFLSKIAKDCKFA